MKNNFFIIFSLFFASFSNSALAQGGCGSHGGDAISLEAFQVAQSLNDQIGRFSEKDFASLPRGFTAAMFKEAFNLTRLDSTADKLYRDDDLEHLHELDAKNFYSPGEDYILINRAHWLQYQDSPKSKTAILLHEYLGIVKALHPTSGEWDEYTLSAAILSVLATKEHGTAIQNSEWIKKIKAQFEKADSSTYLNQIERGVNYSCLETSLLSNGIDPVSREGLYSSSSLLESNKIADTLDARTSSVFSDQMRITERGDLIVLRTEANSKLDFSLTYCSKVGSEVVQMIQYLSESLMPTLKFTQQKEFQTYAKKMRDLLDSNLNKKCADSNSHSSDACWKLMKRLNEISYSPQKSEDLSNNQKRIDTWLAAMGENRDKVATTIPWLQKRYAVHFDTLITLLNFGDSIFGKKIIGENDDLYKAFIDTLEHRIPEGCERESKQFLLETEAAKDTMIHHFTGEF